jgi:hypothetical protein
MSADNLSYTVTPNGSLFAYKFTLQNSGATGGTLYDLFISIPVDISSIDTVTIGTPVGWGDPTGGLLFFGPDVSPATSFIDWAADSSGLYDVGSGRSLPGFSFNSSVSSTGPITFARNGSTTFDAAQQVSNVPEPATLGLMLTALLAIVSARRRRSGTSWCAGSTPPGV